MKARAITRTVTITGAALLSMTSVAQDQLENAVAAAENSTGLQVTTAAAVQATCLDLVGFQPAPGTPQADLLGRCGEMVGTAIELEQGGDDSRSFGWTNNELAASMQQLSGEEQASKGRLATESSDGQFANIAMRLDAIRTGARATTGGVNIAMSGVPVIGGNAGEGDGTGWGWFANGALGFGDRDATDRENEYEYDNAGLTLGADYLFDSGLVLGLAVGFSEFEVDFQGSGASSSRNLTRTNSGGSTEVEGYGLTGYAIHQFGDWTFDGVLTWGENDYDTTRIVQYTASEDSMNADQNREIRGETDSDTLAIGASVGRGFVVGGSDLFFSFGLNYLDVEIAAYEEVDPTQNGGLNLGYFDQEIESLQSRVGAQWSKAFSTGSGVVLPYVRAEWRHEFRNDSQIVTTYYAEHAEVLELRPLEVETDAPTEDFVELALGVSSIFANNIQAFVDYRTSLGIDDTTTNLFTIGIRGAF